VQTTTPEPDSGAIYGIVLNADGTSVALREPQAISDVMIRLGEHLDVATVNTGDRTDRVIMCVDDFGHDKHLPVNAVATALYGTGWPILGNAIVVTDNERPLPTMIVRSLVPDLDNPNLAVAAPIDADVGHVLDWDERLDDIEANYEPEGINFDLDDLELDAIEHDPEPTLKPDPETLDMTTGDPAVPVDPRPTLTVEQRHDLSHRLDAISTNQQIASPLRISDEVRAWAAEQDSPDIAAWLETIQPPSTNADVAGAQIDDGTDLNDMDYDR
jgi:hypothetical protein